jgi:hypothetical protein
MTGVEIMRMTSCGTRSGLRNNGHNNEPTTENSLWHGSSVTHTGFIKFTIHGVRSLERQPQRSAHKRCRFPETNHSEDSTDSIIVSLKQQLFE